MSDTPDQENANVSAQGVVVGSMTVLSRITGLVRDIVLSHVLGASGVADTFFLAFRIPNFFRRLFAEGAFAQAFVPVLAAYRQDGDHAALRAFVGVMAGNLGTALLGVTVLGVLGAWPLAALFMWGLMDEPARFALAVDLTRIVFPYLALVSLAAFVGAALNAANRFAAPAFTPVLLNVALIAAALIGAASATPGATAVGYALAWGVLAAGAAQLLFQLPMLARVGLLAVHAPNWKHPGARKVGRLLVPAVFAASAGQVNALIGTMLAALLEEGSPSWLYYADRLMELPIGIVAVALGTVLLPSLSRLHSAGRQGEYNATLDWGMRTGLLLGVPASAALGLLAHPLVATIFLHGETVARDADMIAAALRAFAIGLVPLVLVKIAAPGYLARQDAKTPAKFAAVAVAANVVASLATFSWLGHVGLALATSIAAFINAGLLIGGLLRAGYYQPSRRLASTAGATVIASAAMSTALWVALPADAWWIDVGHWQRIWALAGLVAGGFGVFAAAALAFGVRPRHLRHAA